MTSLLAQAVIRAEEVAEATGSPGLTKYAWLVALLPLLSAALIVFFGKRSPGRGWIYGVVTVGVVVRALARASCGTS